MPHKLKCTGINEHQWAYMDYGCSNNFRQFVCSLYLPKYDPVTQTVAGPCKEMCSKARNRCKKIKWETRCNELPSKRNDDVCLRPVQESRVEQQHINCVDNVIPMCKSLNSLGSLPNFFLQRSLEEIMTEMRFYEDLVSTNCNANLRFFLCGTYMPLCVPNISPFTIPCREVCDEIQRDCSTHFESIYQGFPWPNKLQCNRYTPSTDTSRHCAMPDKF